METGLDVGIDKTKYMVMSRIQNAGRYHKIYDISFPFREWKGKKYLERS